MARAPSLSRWKDPDDKAQSYSIATPSKNPILADTLTQYRERRFRSARHAVLHLERDLNQASEFVWNSAAKDALLLSRLMVRLRLATVKRIVDAGGHFRSLAEPWADTATSTGRLMIAILGGLADVERDLIRTCTAEGRSRAKSVTRTTSASIAGTNSCAVTW